MQLYEIPPSPRAPPRPAPHHATIRLLPRRCYCYYCCNSKCIVLCRGHTQVVDDGSGLACETDASIGRARPVPDEQAFQNNQAVGAIAIGATGLGSYYFSVFFLFLDTAYAIMSSPCLVDRISRHRTFGLFLRISFCTSRCCKRATLWIDTTRHDG